MEFFITDTNTKSEINIIEPSEGVNIIKAFFAYNGILTLLNKTKINEVYHVSEREFVELNDIAMVENATLHKIHNSPNSNDFSTLLSSYSLAVDVNNCQPIVDLTANDSKLYTMAVEVNKKVQAKYYLIDHLIDGEVAVAAPVNKKFWPLVNTSHTFRMTDAKAVDDIEGSDECWQVEAEMDFVLEMPQRKNNQYFSSKINVVIGSDEGSLFNYYTKYNHSITLSDSQAETAKRILLNAVYIEVAKNPLMSDSYA